jgi:phosphate transport system ATP-binding protein
MTDLDPATSDDAPTRPWADAARLVVLPFEPPARSSNATTRLGSAPPVSGTVGAAVTPAFDAPAPGIVDLRPLSFDPLAWDPQLRTVSSPLAAPPAELTPAAPPPVDPAGWPAPHAVTTTIAPPSDGTSTRLGELPPDPVTVGQLDTLVAAQPRRRRGGVGWLRDAGASASSAASATTPLNALAGLDASDISAWFSGHHVLDRVSLSMPPGAVTALIGPSGCGKSTFLRILNRMHELIPGAALAGEVLLDGADIYDPRRKLTDARRQIGMVFQKPNPFPAMSIYDNVLAGLKLTGTKADGATRDHLVEECLTKAGLWREVRDRLRAPGGGLSGGQQQRLCIARSLAVRPRVLLMDEPCSALDPTSTRRIEQTIGELMSEITIVIVTHNMQQAARVSNFCAFFLAEMGTPGYIVEHGPTEAMFNAPQDPRTADYVAGRFG